VLECNGCRWLAAGEARGQARFSPRRLTPLAAHACCVRATAGPAFFASSPAPTGGFYPRTGIVLYSTWPLGEAVSF
jgi:hypothetical protein